MPYSGYSYCLGCPGVRSITSLLTSVVCRRQVCETLTHRCRVRASTGVLLPDSLHDLLHVPGRLLLPRELGFVQSLPWRLVPALHCANGLPLRVPSGERSTHACTMPSVVHFCVQRTSPDAMPLIGRATTARTHRLRTRRAPPATTARRTPLRIMHARPANTQDLVSFVLACFHFFTH